MKLILFLVMSFLTISCAQSGGTSTGNPLVNLTFNGFTSFAMRDDMSALAVSDLRFCFKRLRFKMASESTNPDPSVDDDNIDFELGEVMVNSIGTNLGAVELPQGTYSRIELDFENNCSGGLSVQVTNGNGSFSTTQRITVKFNGTFTHTSAGSDVSLGLQSIVDALNTVSADDQIRTKMESVSGTF